MPDTYQVLVSYDGCSNWEIDLPDSKGTREECIAFASKHLPPKGYDEYFDIVDLESHRGISYMMEMPARRTRLTEQDLVTRR